MLTVLITICVWTCISPIIESIQKSNIRERETYKEALAVGRGERYIPDYRTNRRILEDERVNPNGSHYLGAHGVPVCSKLETEMQWGISVVIGMVLAIQLVDWLIVWEFS